MSKRTEILKRRDRIIRTIRSFFYERHFTEVETPALTRFPSLDTYIDAIPATPFSNRPPRYLRTSPEYEMKRLIREGMEKIFQLSRAYRKNESGNIHNPEFTLLEWYETYANIDGMIAQTGDLLKTVLNADKIEIISYDELFVKHTGFNFYDVDFDAFRLICERRQLLYSEAFNAGSDRDDFLEFLMVAFIERNLGGDCPVFVKNFPLSQAGFAKPNKDGKTADRFEAYYKGVELCNAYQEITDYGEYRSRFREIQNRRGQKNFERYEADAFFLDAMENGFPRCAGNALGLDRLIMLALEQPDIASVMSFDVNSC